MTHLSLWIFKYHLQHIFMAQVIGNGADNNYTELCCCLSYMTAMVTIDLYRDSRLSFQESFSYFAKSCQYLKINIVVLTPDKGQSHTTKGQTCKIDPKLVLGLPFRLRM